MKKNYLWGIITVRKQLYRTFKLFYMGGSSMKKIRNILSIALVFVMLIGFAPVNVFAEEPVVAPQGQQQGGETVTPQPDTPGQGTPGQGTNPAGQGTDPTGQDTNPADTHQQDPPAQEDLLKNEKAAAKEKINALGNLDESKKTPYISKIDEAQTTDDINKVVLDAQKADALAALEKLTDLKPEEKTAAENAIKAATDENKIKKALEDAKKLNDKNKNDDKQNPGGTENPPAPAAKTYGISVYNTHNGEVRISAKESEAGKFITVTADPSYGYVVDSIVVKDGKGNTLTLSNTKYKNYYNDYPYYLRSRWYRGYDYDDYIRWCNTYDYSRYDYDSFKTWCRRNGYRYDYDDFKRFCDWDDIDDYRWYNRYGYSYLNQADFVMPNSAVTVEVTFTSAPYWYDGYYYDYETGTYRRYYGDDYYYYRYRRNKKDNYYERQKKAEEKAKEEEEAKAKAEAEKLPQVYENKAVIAIGSNVLDKVSKNVHTVHQMDAPAYVNGGRVMLPLRYVAEALGLQVSWVPETKTVIIWDLTQRVEIPVKSNRIIVNGITYTSDVKPEIKNERTMLPIANIARALGLIDGSDIVWDQYNKQVTLTRKVLSK